MLRSGSKSRYCRRYGGSGDEIQLFVPHPLGALGGGQDRVDPQTAVQTALLQQAQHIVGLVQHQFHLHIGVPGVVVLENRGDNGLRPGAVDAEANGAHRPRLDLLQPALKVLLQIQLCQQLFLHGCPRRSQGHPGPAGEQGGAVVLFQPSDMVGQALLTDEGPLRCPGKVQLLRQQEKQLLTGVHGTTS